MLVCFLELRDPFPALLCGLQPAPGGCMQRMKVMTSMNITLKSHDQQHDDSEGSVPFDVHGAL